MCIYLAKNKQITTRWADNSEIQLNTALEEHPLPSLGSGEIIVEVLYVPLHGSFWLSSHPDAIHPRKEEFLAEGKFVFGNGGVGRVVASNEDARQVRVGDYVCVFGHVPCSHYDCYACTVLHRYTECDYSESSIIGHGKHSSDGTYAKYAILPRYSYEVCYRAEETPSEEDLTAYMFGFLVADVRNALTRHPDSLRMRRMLLLGAGFSGHIAAYLHNRTCPESKIVAVDSNAERLKSLKEIAPEAIHTIQLDDKTVEDLNKKHQSVQFRSDLGDAVERIREEVQEHFKGRGCNLLFDSSSGNTTPLWDNARILGPAAHCIPFGFGSQCILVDSQLMQCSGLNISMSRGVGNIRNRKEVIELIKAGASGFINRCLVSTAKRLGSLEEAMRFIEEVHAPPLPLHQIPHAYMCPNPHQDT